MKVMKFFAYPAILFSNILSPVSPLDIVRINPLVAHVHVLQELKERFKTNVVQPSIKRTDKIPTKQHLVAVNKPGWNSGWGASYLTKVAEDQNTYKNIFNKIVEREHHYSNDHYIFYHAQTKSFRVLQDFLKEVYSLLGIEAPLNDFEFLRVVHTAEKTFDQNSFINKEEGALAGLARWNDHRSDLVKNMLCVNLALFGNLSNMGEHTFSYFKNSTSISAFGVVESVTKQFFTDLGLSDKYINELTNLHSLISTKEGNLFQIIIPKNKVDQYVYLSHEFGTPYRDIIDAFVYDRTCKRHIKISPVLDAYINNPEVITDFDKLQARILLSQDGMLNPESGIKIFRYINATDHALEKYKKAVQDLASKVVSDAIQNKTLKNIKNTRLDKLLSFIKNN